MTGNQVKKKRGFSIFFHFFLKTRSEEVFGRMVEQTIEGWLTVLEKNGLRQVSEILGNACCWCVHDSHNGLVLMEVSHFSALVLFTS